MFFFKAGGPDNQEAKPWQKVKEQTPAQRGQGTGLGNVGSKSTAADTAEDKEQIITIIEEAAISYSSEELPKIQPFLLHPDAEVREAALLGMVRLGDAAAAPMLRAASQQAPSPDEAVSMRQAAAFVELPSGTLLNINRKRAAAR